MYELHRNNLVIIISAPSGVGKTTISRALFERDKSLVQSISVTTRPKSDAEMNGKDYHFVTEDEFQEMLRQEDLLEHAQIFGYHYGIQKSPIMANMKNGRDVVFNIDWQGARKLRDIPMLQNNVVSIFLLPPSLSELARRIKLRGRDDEVTIEKRLNKAKEEIYYCKEYDYVIVNEDFDKCVDDIMHIIKAERIKHQTHEMLLNDLLT